MSNTKTIHVVTLAGDGSIRTREYQEFDQIAEFHDQIGLDDCSTDLTLRGLPLFRGLIGPLADGKTIVRYESPDVYEAMTAVWSNKKVKRRRRRRTKVDTPETTEEVETTESPQAEAPSVVPTPLSMKLPNNQMGIKSEA